MTPNTTPAIAEYLSHFTTRRVLVVGDAILDEYLLGDCSRNFHILGKNLDRLRIGVSPVDRLGIDLHELGDGGALRLEDLRVDDVDPDGLVAHLRHLAGARDDPALAFLHILKTERHHRPADVDLPGHHLRRGAGNAAGRDRLRLGTGLLEQSQ
jgi:hypothetical protein